MIHQYESLKLHVWGNRACFTRPEMKAERVSYDVMTPSAARGVLEAIFWKPQMRWIVDRIDILKPIIWDTIRRNEVGQRASINNVRDVMNGKDRDLGIDIEVERQQRSARILRDVGYVIHAHIELTNKAGPADTLNKYIEMFKRRAGKGQCFHRPYLGTREFAANFALIDEGMVPEQQSMNANLGWMLFDIDHQANPIRPLFFRANIINGSVTIPHPSSEELSG